MSHELRTPLNSILLLSRLLYENNDDNLNADQVEYAKVIQSSGNGLLSLIDEILDLSKIEAGKMQLEYEATAITSITEDMRMLFEPMAKDKQIAFEIKVNEKSPAYFETDKQRLEQVLKNLISNAMKFTSKGSITLSVDKHPHNEHLLSFAVIDTGIGIPEDKQKLIFEAFQQADGSTRRKYGGTGLGLSISRELVRLLGGTIELQSAPGEGSTFTVSVPANKDFRIEQNSIESFFESLPEKETKKESWKEEDVYVLKDIPESIPDDRTQISSDDRAILIVEDDVNFAKSLLEFTRNKGYKGVVCVRGDEAIDCARRYNPVGILLDIQLPVKSGWEVMEELKNNPQTRHIPVHIMSSYEVRRESILKGAVDFVSKPVAFDQIQEIFEKLEYVLNRQSNKVLIIEENPKHAKALAYFLETFNINSEIKNTIADSVDALRNEADCVILDMGIPDQKTYDMLEEVKKTEGLENLPIIIFTGKSLSMAEEQRIKQYADSIVIKTAHSYQRILDEISLFLHLVEENKSKPETNGKKKLGALNEVLKGKTVLVVDDDVRNIFSLTKALERMDMNIIPAIDGKDAIQKLQEHSNINIVLLDMMMPEMDGYETAKRIRAEYKWKDLPVIAVTAKAMLGDREKCIQAGASDYITKPVDIDQLLSLLRVWLYERV
jgi:CheY-like chemotaxis protein/two-component sensor histidine kinase